MLIFSKLLFIFQIIEKQQVALCCRQSVVYMTRKEKHGTGTTTRSVVLATSTTTSKLVVLGLVLLVLL